MLLFLNLSTYLLDSIEDVQIITTNLEKAAARVELQISQDKTKAMVIQQNVSDRTSDEIKVEGKAVETGQIQLP